MPVNPKCRVAAISLAALCAAGPAASQQALPVQPSAPATAESADTVGFELRRRMTVGVRIDGKGPYSFIVDTGAERTVISGKLAQELALEAGKPVRMHSMTGADRVATAVIGRLEMTRKRVADIHAPVLREAHMGASGILGTDTLQKQTVDFDFARQKMSIAPSRNREPRGDSNTIVVTARSRFGRLILVDADLEGEKVLVVLDTGSEATIGNAALRRKLVSKRKLKKTTPIDLISVTGGRIVADYTQVGKMRLGNVVIEQMPVGFAEVHPFAQLDLRDRPAILLGMDALELFSRVSVDFTHRKVTFHLRDDLRRREARIGSTFGAASALR